MIYQKNWYRNKQSSVKYTGWFLFGIIPLYIVRAEIGCRRKTQ